MKEHSHSSAFKEKQPSIIALRMQPNFPHEDLSDNNSAMLEYILQNDDGLEAHAERLQHSQRQIHLIANRALQFLGIKTRYAEEELLSFSRGFAGFEIINDLVHPPRTYDMLPARHRIEKLFIDTRDFFELQLEEFYRSQSEHRSPAPVTRDRPAPELDLAHQHMALARNLPNTFGVLLQLGAAHNETMAQLQTRAMGAQLAHSLQVTDLDDTR